MNSRVSYFLIISIIATSSLVAGESPEYTGVRGRIQERRAEQGTVRERVGQRREARQSARAERRDTVKGRVQERRSGENLSGMTYICQQDPMNPACTEQSLE